MDTAYSLQIYEICGEKATFSFFLKKEEKTRAGKRGTGSAGKRMREEKAEYTDGAYRFKVGISAEAGPPAMIHELAEK